ncbi:ABC transporter permease [Streptococcus iniae]|uniref:ABC transporter permease n=1 Tax=Streptococcus iniae TaxID=1346 RepID=UPI0008DA340E|nr:ABC transporter permease [Streptococcus iniae]OHX27931.1 ABC transporter permease [Streptococcus iniae]RLV28603.1 ABC transporter permease [Streptococcus iniae]
MKVAWSELRYQPKKYILIELLIVLMIFMVIFLTGLTNGLGRAVSAQIDNYGNKTYLLSEDAEGIITFSNISKDLNHTIEDLALKDKAELVIQRSGVQLGNNAQSKDLTYFAIEKSDLLNPKIVEGKALSAKEGEIVLDSSFKETLSIGSSIRDKASQMPLKVVGFTDDAMYGHSAVGFITPKTFETMKKASNPKYQWQAQAIVTSNVIKPKKLPKGIKAYQKEDIIAKIPGYQAEHLTLTMITWVLLIASSAILGVFFYILTLQKLKQFGVLKAIGMSMTAITGIQLSQITLLSLFGLVTGLGLTSLLASILPSAMPFYLKTSNVLLESLSFLVISISCGALSLFKVRQVDPVEVIGGNGE